MTRFSILSTGKKRRIALVRQYPETFDGKAAVFSNVQSSGEAMPSRKKD
jgi:hypothetical protein